MALKTRKLAAATMVAAAFSMAAAPAEAQSRYRRDRVDAGDVIGGVLVLGTIAAIASAVTRSNRDRYDDRYPGRVREGDYRYQQQRSPYQGSAGNGIDRAVDMCVGEIENGRDRVGSVDMANRDRDGWAVSGTLQSGQGFSCRIGNDGRIADLDLGNYGYGTAPAQRVDDRGWEDQGYTGERDSNGDGVADDAPARDWNDQAYSGAGVDNDTGQGQWDDEDYARARENYDRNNPPPLPQGGF